jgi:hypothetical protein
VQQGPLTFGTRVFTDGSTRTVYLDLAGRQYVLGDDGRLVYGTWLGSPPSWLGIHPTRMHCRTECNAMEAERRV